MRNPVKWIFPFAAGLLTYHFIFTHNQSVDVDRRVPVATAASPKTRVPAALPPVIAKPPAVQIPQPKELVKVEKPKHVLDLSLSESTIAQMEQSWNDLPQLAEARREDRGWRLTRLDSQSGFYRAGLREGDLITEEFLDRLRNTNSALVLRMEQILNRITR